MSASDFNPDIAQGSPALTTLRRLLAARMRDQFGRVVHPRADHVWLQTDPAPTAICLGEKRQPTPLSEVALRELCALLDVSPALLSRLQGLRGDILPSLINRLLWQAGEDRSYRLRLVDHGGTIVSVHSGSYASVDHRMLCDELARLDQGRGLSLLRFELKGDEIRLVLVDSSTNQGQWSHGVVITNMLGGGRSLVTCPALVGPGGVYTLPVVPDRSSVIKRTHRGDSDKALVEGLIQDVITASRSVHYADASARWEALGTIRYSAHQMPGYLDTLQFPWTSKGHHTAVQGSLKGRGGNLQGVLLQVLRSLGETEPFARLRVELHCGQIMWIRGKSSSGSRTQAKS